jgi:hypothetical protein
MLGATGTVFIRVGQTTEFHEGTTHSSPYLSWLMFRKCIYDTDITDK